MNQAIPFNPGSATDAFVRKLETLSRLPNDDKEMIRSINAQSAFWPAGSDIITEGEQPADVNLVASGFAFRYKLLPEGSRQIVAYLMPGDICDLHVSLLDKMDHSIAALTDVQIVKLPRNLVEALLDRPAIARALLMVTLVNEANSREWLANIGARMADSRMAHFLCEWHLRMKSIGLADDNECAFPLTQSIMSETLGLSVVHVNRTLQLLRGSELIELGSRRLRLLDPERMWEMCGFRSNYLHLLSKKYR